MTYNVSLPNRDEHIVRTPAEAMRLGLSHVYAPMRLRRILLRKLHRGAPVVWSFNRTTVSIVAGERTRK